jgi:hypothetical protein
MEMILPDAHVYAGGVFPGPAGFVAFAGVKFAGYVLAGRVLRKVYPSLAAAPVKIAAVRTGLGIVLGPVLVLGFAALIDTQPGVADSNVYAYLMLVGVRLLVWALVIWIFLRRTLESRRYVWASASAGALWSCLLDIPAVFLLEIAPGRIPIC